MRTAPRQARRPVLSHAPYVLILVIVAAGLVRIAQYHWREGTVLIGGALLVAALVRSVLPQRLAGLIAIRGRVVDVLSYAGLGLLILFVALTITGGPLRP